MLSEFAYNSKTIHRDSRSGLAARRNLFETTSRDHRAASGWLSRKLQDLEEDYKTWWNFDFASCIPCEGKWVWKPVARAFSSCDLDVNQNSCKQVEGSSHCVENVPPARSRRCPGNSSTLTKKRKSATCCEVASKRPRSLSTVVPTTVPSQAQYRITDFFPSRKHVPLLVPASKKVPRSSLESPTPKPVPFHRSSSAAASLCHN